MSLVVAIYGESCSGKTTVSEIVKTYLTDAKIRHCGEALKARAQILGLSVKSISANKEENTILDQETRTLASLNRGTLIIEGRYLDEVLHDILGVLFIRLDCSLAEAAKRKASRASLEERVEDRAPTFSSIAISSKCKNHFIIDTDGTTPQMVACEITKLIRNHDHTS
jgi:cytidylate kinase